MLHVLGNDIEHLSIQNTNVTGKQWGHDRPGSNHMLATQICRTLGKDEGIEAKAYNSCITPQAAYCSCSGAVHVTDSRRTAYGPKAKPVTTD